jgi:hypothetical protein
MATYCVRSLRSGTVEFLQRAAQILAATLISWQIFTGNQAGAR